MTPRARHAARATSSPIPCRAAHCFCGSTAAHPTPTDGLPPGFAEKLKSPAIDANAERSRLLSIASNLFRLLGNADNGVVLRERRRQIRETLNALRALDGR